MQTFSDTLTVQILMLMLMAPPTSQQAVVYRLNSSKNGLVLGSAVVVHQLGANRITTPASPRKFTGRSYHKPDATDLTSPVQSL